MLEILSNTYQWRECFLLHFILSVYHQYHYISIHVTHTSVELFQHVIQIVQSIYRPTHLPFCSTYVIHMHNWSVAMVIRCSKHSDCDTGVSFYRIPDAIGDKGQRELELSSRRKDGYLAAISRKDLDINNLHKYRICLRHFSSGQAQLYDCTNPDWLPALNLGHSKWEKPALSLACIADDLWSINDDFQLMWLIT